MSGASIIVDPQVLRVMHAHLFPLLSRVEQGGFLLCSMPPDDKSLEFSVLDWIPLRHQDYRIQAIDYLELADEAHVRIIKTAQQQQAALVEVHCHPGACPACFSHADIAGLAEFVAHVR
jgi:hypothetical protein